MKKVSTLLNSPGRVVVAVGLIILVSEYLIMSLAGIIPSSIVQNDDWQFIDPILLTTIVSPILYFLIYRPLCLQALFEKQIDELQRFQKVVVGRELRMKKLVEENAVLRRQTSAEKTGEATGNFMVGQLNADTAALPAETGKLKAGQRDALLFMLEDLEEARNKIEQAHQQWMKALDVVPDPIFLHDREFRVLRANRAYAARAGISFKDFIGKPYYRIFPKLAGPLSTCLRALKTGQVETEELTLESGEIIRSRSSPVYDAQGEYLHSIHILEDITERKRFERELTESEQRFRGVVEQSLAGIYIIQDGRFVYANPRLAEIFGYASPADLIGLESTSLVAEQDRSIVVENMRRYLEDEALGFSHRFITGLRSDGSLIDVDVHGARATHGGRPAIIGMLQDVSEKKHAEEQIQRHVAQLEVTFLRTIELATTLIEMRDPYTAGHEKRVALIAAAIGTELGLDAHRIEGLRVGGYIHDIGKIIVPAEILAKPGRLSDVEYMLIKEHPQAGYDILKNVDFPWPVADIAYQHHERMDGSGYPRGLKEEEILLEARITAVADVVEAMSTHRPYRPGLGLGKALAEIERGRGKLYCPQVTDACLRLFREKGFELPPLDTIAQAGKLKPG